MAGVSVGEIEATFRLRDELTPQLNVAQRHIADVSKDLEGMAAPTKEVEANFRRIGAAIGAAFSLRELSQMAGQITQSTSQINDLALKMGIGTTAVQELKFAAEQSGGSIEQIGNALALMGDKLTEGGKGTVAAVQSLGLSLDTLRASSPDQAFTAIASAISQIEDPMVRSNMAMELFSRAGASLLPVLTSDIEGLRVKAQEMGLVISEDLVRRGDDLGDSWEAMQGRIEGARTRALLPALDVFLQLPQPIQTGIGLISEFSGVFSGLALAIMAAGGPVAAFTAVSGAATSVGGVLVAIATGPIGLLVGAVAGLGLAWYAWGDDVTEVVSSTYAAVKSWLWDKLEPVLTPLIGLLDSIGKMFEAFGKLVGAVFGKIVDVHVDAVRTIVMWLSDRLEPVFRPIGVAVEFLATVFGRAYQAISLVVQNTYNAVKTWLLDRFTGIVDGIKGKIDAVTGFFNNMYMAVVGGSIVPDMINGIASEFGRLGSVMVEPTGLATGGVQGLFSGLFTNISKTASDGFKDMLSRTSVFGGEFSGAWSGIANSVGGLFDSMMGKLSSFITSGKFSLDQFLLDFETFGASLSARATILMATEWFKAFIGPHYTIGGGEEDERRRREEDERYFPQIPGYEPPSNEGTGNPYPFAAGGIVTRPTMGLVGEAGPEAIIPLKNWNGMGGGVNIYIDAGGAVFADDSSIRRFADKLLPQLSYALRREGLATA